MFTQVLDDIAPEKEIRIKGRTEPWIEEEILEAIHERDRALFKANRNKLNHELREKYNKLRNKVVKMIRQAKANHFSKKVEEYKNNSKQLWEQLKSLGYSNKIKEKSRIILEICNEKCFDPIKVVNNISNYFLTVAETLKSKIPLLPKVYDTESQHFKDFYNDKGITPKSFNISKVSEEFIYKELCNLNPNKSMGIDGIKPKFLKDGADVIKNAITHITNLSIESGTFPDEHKFAIVKPLHKKNSRLDVGNYRPISLLSPVSKIIEKAIYVQIEQHLKENNILYEFQSGFRKSYSTDTCLINLIDHLRMIISQGNYAGMVMLDLQKAFDTVDHDILCKKLEAMGINFTKWFESYLKGRKQIVIANETRSEIGTVTCGVPQGSILGPLLFLCYVNDMPISTKCKLLLYADDSALIVEGSDPKVIADRLSEELNSCRQWLIDNKLSLHLGKTEAILFGTKAKVEKVKTFSIRCGDVTINNVKKVKYLGQQIDNDLSSSSVVDDIVKKSNSRLKFLYRYKDILNFDTKKILCTALIQCHFDYSCSSWYPGTNLTLRKKLNIMQNKIVRFVLNLDYRASINNKELVKAGFLSVPDRVKQLQLGHVFKINKNISPKYLTCNFKKMNEDEDRVATRAKQHNFDLPRISPITFAFTAIKWWNALPDNIKAIKNEKAFKDNVKKQLRAEAEKTERCQFKK